jgi:hypothetical protein
MLARDGTEVWVRDEAYAMPDDTQSGRRVSQGLLVDTTTGSGWSRSSSTMPCTTR